MSAGTSTVRVGVVGTGVMGADHASRLRASVGGATLVGVTDIDPSRAAVTADALGARTFDDAESLIGSDEVDAVLVASHDSAHAEQVLACIEAGKPVLCEKPLAPSLAECERIVAAEAATGAELVSVGFMRRFHQGFTALRAQLSTGELGAPLLIHGSHRNVASYPFGGSEGTITNTAVHDIDIVGWMLDEPVVEVSWHAPRTTGLDDARQDPQLIHLRTTGGTLAAVELFVNARYGYDTRYEVVCERGAAHLRPLQPISVDHELMRRTTHPTDWRPFYADAYRAELQAWVDSVRTGATTDLARSRDGLRATRVAEALIRSMHADGARVAVGQ